MSNVATVLLVAAIIGGYFWFAPKPLGGPVSYIVTDGSSMEPSLHDNDLVIVREASSYSKGDVVAYESESLGRTILHRVIRVDAGRYVFKGDNNNFIDQDRPREADILGKQWYVIPGGGEVIDWIGNPIAATALAFVVALILLIGFRLKAKRRSTARPATVTRAPGSATRPSLYAVTSLATASFIFVVVGAVAFRQPATRAETHTIRYRHEGTFSYESEVARSQAYPNGVVSTGRPIYLELVDSIEVHFRYGLHVASQHQITGSTSMTAVLSNPSGWTQRVELAGDSSFDGDETTVSGTLDLSKLAAAAARLERETGVQETAYSLSISPQVVVSGLISDQIVDQSFSPTLQLDFDPLKVKLPQPGAPSDQALAPADPLRPVASASVDVPEIVPNTVILGPVELPLEQLRWAALGLAGACALFALALFLLGRRQRGEPALIERRYGHWMIPVESLHPTSGRTAVEVGSMSALVQMAERYDRLILHEEDGGIHSYVVEEANIAYWFQAFEPSVSESNVRSLPKRGRAKKSSPTEARHSRRTHRDAI
jgi:signal peptidase I